MKTSLLLAATTFKKLKQYLFREEIFAVTGELHHQRREVKKKMLNFLYQQHYYPNVFVLTSIIVVTP